MILPVVAVVLTQGPVPKWLVARSVRKATGADFSASWVSLKLDGRFVATDAKLTAPASSGLTGDSALIAQARRIDVVLDWSAWAAGVVVPQSVRVVEPVVRISADRSTNQLNLSALKASGGASSIARVPRIEVDRGILVLAEHGPPPPDAAGSAASPSSEPEEMFRLETNGWISPVFGTKRYLIHLRAKNPSDERMAFDMNGDMDLANFHSEVRTTPIDLAALTRDRLPSATRDIWEKLHLRGKIADTVIRYTPDSGLDTTLSLEDVSLNAPIASGRAEITGSRSPRMENVAGTLRLVWAGPAQGLHADLRGLFEDLPARVRLDSQALALNAGYSAVVLADKFQLEKDPRILWFTPEVVQKNFELFSGPTAVIDARIEINRKPSDSSGAPGETAIAGTLVFENGSAAYGLFPYPMTAMSGSVRFDEEGVQIIGIQGRGPSGARLFGEGTIDTSTPDGAYDIRVTATDVPIDATLKAALLASPGAPMVDAVFSKARMEELLAKGLIRSPGPDKVAAADGAPPFDVLSGMVDSIQVHVVAWGVPDKPPVIHQDIAVRFKDVHALPQLFPYPLSGTDVSVRIGDDYIAAHGEGLTGLFGGRATLDARVDILPESSGLDATHRYRPTIHLKTEHFPIEPVLINALPGADEASAGGGAAAGAEVAAVKDAGFSIKSFLSRLHLQGPVDADITVLPGARPQDDPTITTAILFEGVTARPEHITGAAGEPLVLEGLIGAMRAGESGVSIDALEGRLSRREDVRGLSAGGTEQQEGPPLAAKFRVDGEWMFGRAEAGVPAHVDLAVSVRDLNVALAAEDLLRPLSASGAKEIETLRAERQPQGRIDLAMQVQSLPAAAPGLAVAAQITRGQNLSLSVADQRVELVQEAGSLGVLAQMLDAPKSGPAPVQPPVRLTLDHLAAQLKLDGETMGSVTADGVLSPPSAAAEGHAATPLLVHEPVDLTLRGLRLESPVARRLAERFGGPTATKFVMPYEPEGLVDGEVRLALPPGETDPAHWAPMLAIRPRWLAITTGAVGGPDRQRLLFPLISGEIRVDGAGGTFDELTLVDQGWNARFNGAWTRGAASSGQGDQRDEGPHEPLGADAWAIKGLLDLEADGLPASLVALFPPSLAAGLEGSRVQVLDDLAMPGVNVRLWSRGGDGAPTDFSISGKARFSGLYADPGIAIDDANGVIGFSAERTGDAPPRTRLTIEDAALRITGLRVTGATGEINLPGDGSAKVPSLQGEAYGGRLLMSADAAQQARGGEGSGRDPSAGPPPVGYTGSIQLAGVRFADLLHDLERTKPVGGGPVPSDTLIARDNEAQSPDGSRGLVEAQIAVEGVSGDPASRLGRGEVRIAGGRAVLDVPGLTPLLSLAALQLPVSSPLDFAHADVHVVGGTIYFDSLAILSDSLALLGAGTMKVETGALDLRMATRGRTKLPLLTDMLDMFRDELVTARIRGTPASPELKLENFGAVRAAFKGQPNPLSEALHTDLDRLERDRQRTLGVSNGPVAQHGAVSGPVAAPEPATPGAQASQRP